MDLSNKEGGLVVGTGDLSELALGFCTFAGDHISMYDVNASVPKTLVRKLVGWVADHHGGAEERAVLREVLDTPVSPELVPPGRDGAIAQRTEEILGPYELHDFFLFCLIRLGAGPGKILFLAGHAFASAYDPATIRRWLRVFLTRFFDQQFKRSVMPDGPKVGSVSLSPRGDWRMPSDASMVALARGDFDSSEIELIQAGVNAILRLPPDPDWDDRLARLMHVPRRRNVHVPVHLVVQESYDSTEQVVPVVALNLSVNGMLVE